MSIVAWDGKTLAADKQSIYGNVKYTTKKLWKLSNGELIAFVGDLDAGLTMKHWYESGAKTKEWPETQKGENSVIFIVVSISGCFHYESLPYAIETLDSIRAWGVGKEVALGAMAMGADAVKAVGIASKYVSGCGMGCDFEVVRKVSESKAREPAPLKKRRIPTRREW